MIQSLYQQWSWSLVLERFIWVIDIWSVKYRLHSRFIFNVAHLIYQYGGLMQEKSKSIAQALELGLSYNNPSNTTRRI